MSSARTLTLADVAWPRAGVLRNALLVLLASLLTAAAAQVAFPVPGSLVPITGQTFAVLLSGALLGPRRAFLAQALYLLEGAGGLPFFAGGMGGIAVFAGPSAGYLVAFPFAAALTGWLCARGWDRRFVTMFAAMLIGSALILALGVSALSRFVPPAQLFAAGLLPFVPGDLVKAAAAALAFPAIWKGVGERSGIGA